MEYRNRPGAPIQRRGPHLKICKCGCEQEFYGRNNQVFLDSSHKDLFHNLEKSNQNKEMKPMNDIIKNNHRLLKKHYPKSKGEKWIHKGDLIQEGFEGSVITGLSKNSHNGRHIYKIQNYSYSLSEDNKQIIIYKKLQSWKK